MLYFDRIDVNVGIDVNKTNELKECDICHYWYFLKKKFKFQPNFCNRCHDSLMMSVNLSDIAILNIKSSNYRYIISGISKNEVTNLMQKSKFYLYKSPAPLRDVDIEKVLISNKISSGGKKYKLL